MKIMIVDDHPDIVETIKMVMESEGYKTATGYNGQELLDRVNEEDPNLVLLDVMMPGLTTKQLLERLKEKGKGDLKIILVTVVRFSDEEKKSLMDQFNIVDYVTKPFDVPDLVARVKKQLK